MYRVNDKQVIIAGGLSGEVVLEIGKGISIQTAQILMVGKILKVNNCSITIKGYFVHSKKNGVLNEGFAIKTFPFYKLIDVK